MKYKILIKYSTGDSFGQEDAERYLDLIWENLEVAKQNLVRIQEHYSQHRELQSYSFRDTKRTKEQIFKSNEDKDWFAKPDPDHKYLAGKDYYNEHCITLKTDDGKDYQISAFWCGYFESLYSAEIVPDQSDMKIEF